MTRQSATDPAELRDILECEHAVWRALVTGDTDADRDLLLPEFLGVYPTGFANRGDHANQLSDGPSVTSYRLSDERLLALGPDFRLLCYRAEYHRVGETDAEAMYVSSVWQRQGHEWKNLFSQDTPVGEALGV